MILDKGICSVYRKVNTAEAGAMPVFAENLIYIGWYGELDFETRSARPTNDREEIRCDAKIRILQCRTINNHDKVELQTQTGDTLMYEVTRAYHGYDEDSGELISDLTLEVYEP